MSSALAATTRAPAARALARAPPSRARRVGTPYVAAAPRPRSRSHPSPSSFRGPSGRVGAGSGGDLPTDDASVTSADEDTLVADVDAYVAAHGDEHDEHGHSHDEHDDSSHDDDASAVTTEHGSVLWREFARAATGVWGGCCVEFDADGVAQDIPLRYVHGVGRVPAQNMPFREQELDWMTKNTTESNDGGDGLVINTKRAMPTIGNEDAISSCGGAEWGEHVAFVEDEPLCILRGANEDKTVLPDGSFSAGSRFLRTESNATDAAHHCLAHPDDPDARTRVVHRVRRCEKENASGDDDTPLFRWRTESIEVWFEQRGVNNGGPKCVAPFSNDAILAKSALVSDASRWRCVPESSAVYFLMWDDDEYATDATDADQKSFFTMLADAGEAENLVFLDGGGGDGDGDGDETGRGEKKNRSAADSLDGLVRLPGNVWVYCGYAGAHDVGVGAGGEEGQLVLECGWQPEGSSMRTVSTRAYDAETGRLDSASLARETMA